MPGGIDLLAPTTARRRIRRGVAAADALGLARLLGRLHAGLACRSLGGDGGGGDAAETVARHRLEVGARGLAERVTAPQCRSPPHGRRGEHHAEDDGAQLKHG